MIETLDRWIFSKRQDATTMIEDQYEIGPYTIEKTKHHYILRKDDNVIGVFKSCQIQGYKALLEKRWHTYIEVTPSGCREVISVLKARLLAGIAGDGAVWKTSFKFINSDHKLLNMYMEALKEVYKVEHPHIYIDYREGKNKPCYHIVVNDVEMARDVKKYIKKKGAEYWRIPIKNLTKEAAIEFINFYLSCDGTIDIRPHKSTAEIVFKSESIEALRDLKQLLKQFFNITTHFRKPQYNKGVPTYRLAVSGRREVKKFLRHGLTSYRTDHKAKLKKLRQWVFRVGGQIYSSIEYPCFIEVLAPPPGFEPGARARQARMLTGLHHGGYFI